MSGIIWWILTKLGIRPDTTWECVMNIVHECTVFFKMNCCSFEYKEMLRVEKFFYLRNLNFVLGVEW